jgi:hypothetical protein
LEYDPLKEVYEIKENTWGFNYLFKEEELFSKIESYKTINPLGYQSGKGNNRILSLINLHKNFKKQQVKFWIG